MSSVVYFCCFYTDVFPVLDTGIYFVEKGILDVQSKSRKHPCDVEAVNLSIAYIAALLENVEGARKFSLVGALIELQKIEQEKRQLKLSCNMNTLVLAAIRATMIKSDKASRVC
jgi:hypothetical protein